MISYIVLSDDELTSLLKKRDHAAFTEIYNRYWSLLYLHARRLLSEEEQARDVVQEVFTGIWNKCSQLEFTINLNAYLYKSVRNTILNLVRHEKVKENYLTDLGTFYDEGSFQTDELVRYNELRRLIENEIMQLPPKMREIFEMSRNGNLSHAEIAKQLSLSDQTVKKQVNKALRILRIKFRMPLSVLLILLGM